MRDRGAVRMLNGVSALVWIGSACGVASDAMPGTELGDERECDYCTEGGCVETAQAASEFEELEGDVDPDDEAEELEAYVAQVMRDARR